MLLLRWAGFLPGFTVDRGEFVRTGSGDDDSSQSGRPGRDSAERGNLDETWASVKDVFGCFRSPTWTNSYFDSLLVRLLTSVFVSLLSASKVGVGIASLQKRP